MTSQIIQTTLPVTNRFVTNRPVTIILGRLKLPLPLPLKDVQYNYFNNRISYDEALACINLRRDCDINLFFKRLNPEKNTSEFVRSKASFRGNDVYRARVWNRHKELINFCDLNKDISYILKDEGSAYCSIFKCTLTCDIKNWSMNEWNGFYCSYFLDLFVKRVRNDFGNCVIARSYEVSKERARGYFHINVIILFLDRTFDVYPHKSKIDGRLTWRLRDKKLLADLYDGGFSDIRALENPKDVAEYSLKYHIKEFTNEECKENQRLTLSTLSLFGKRSFSFPRGSIKRGSKDFCESIIDYTVYMSSVQNNALSNVVFPRLDIIMHNSLKYEFLCCLTDFDELFDNNLWFEVIKKLPDDFG